ncbi:hypothetical protein [Sphingomonas sp. NFR15]|uniref:hypothetical protein n=1 Tax=Sphingomonas sp. NFR15 TaxID=1566282 RepID=UPI000890C2DC|nr:hypothetical protein [Sphingomonas sp. NFR15]SDA36901.1 hypothetical protein SAMN03159340_04008 [Sphingomonas sp. NFR15]
MLNTRSGMINSGAGDDKSICRRTVIEADFRREGRALDGYYQPLPAGACFVQFRIIAIDLGDLVVKIDREGVKLGIVKKVAQSGLWDGVSAVKVELRHAFPGKIGADLIAPLKKAGFIVFDRSPHTLVNNDNGFPCAARQCGAVAA